jgi:hypothetical protein
MQDDIAIRNELPDEERIGNIAEPHFQAGTQGLRYVPQVPDIAATVVPRKRTDSKTFPQQQLGNVAADKAARSGNQNAMGPRHFRCTILIKTT